MKICICVLLVTFIFVKEVTSYRCHSCLHFLKYHECPSLGDRKCEIVRQYCGCCDECALNLGEKCSSTRPRCATGLMCVNDQGEALQNVPPYMKGFIGVCQSVVISPLVIENTDVKERRIRI